MEKEKVSQLFSDKEFLKVLFKVRSEADIRELFGKYNIELTAEEIEEIYDIVEVCTSGFTVLPESSLEDVVGGMANTDIVSIFKDNYDLISQVLKINKNLM